MDEIPWFVFEMPFGTIAFVHGASEPIARSVLRSNCYKDAPVEDWPVLMTRFCSREALVQHLLGRPYVGQATLSEGKSYG